MPTWDDMKDAEIVSHSRLAPNIVTVTIRIPTPPTRPTAGTLIPEWDALKKMQAILYSRSPDGKTVSITLQVPDAPTRPADETRLADKQVPNLPPPTATPNS